MSFTNSIKAQERLKHRERSVERQRAEDIRAVMSIPEGRRFVWYVTQGLCGVLTHSSAGDARTFLAEGRRSVACELLAEIEEICPPLHSTMFHEAFAARQEDAVHLSSARDAATREDE